MELAEKVIGLEKRQENPGTITLLYLQSLQTHKYVLLASCNISKILYSTQQNNETI